MHEPPTSLKYFLKMTDTLTFDRLEVCFISFRRRHNAAIQRRNDHRDRSELGDHYDPSTSYYHVQYRGALSIAKSDHHVDIYLV